MSQPGALRRHRCRVRRGRHGARVAVRLVTAGEVGGWLTARAAEHVRATPRGLGVAALVVVAPHEVNGRPGVVIHHRDGRVLAIIAFDVLDGRIQTIRAVLDPDKPARPGPVADAWQLREEVLARRRPGP